MLEAKTVLLCLRHRVRSQASWKKRHMVMVDSQVSLGAITKGRSSRRGMNYVCRRIGALQLAFLVKPYLRWVPTKRNFADGPSRGFPVGVAPSSIPQRVRRPEMMEQITEEMPEHFRHLAG